jgi:DNA repair protein RadC
VVADSLLEDIAIFQHVKDAGDILGIKLLAHIVLSTGGTVRFL